MSTPITNVMLLSVPIDMTYKNEIYFGNTTEQINYFSSKIIKSYTSCTYQRKDKCIRIDANYEDIANCNYVMYLNKGKYYYAFITKIEYVNEGVSFVYIKTDVYQTWLFNTTIKPSFVVREHVTDDTVGKNIIDEGLDTGEYKQKSNTMCSNFTELWYVVGHTAKDSAYGDIYGNLYSGLRYTCFDNSTSINNFIKAYDDASQGDAIVIIFTIPKAFLPDEIVDGMNIPAGFLGNFNNYDVVVALDNLDGYVPKNKKLFTYPYTYLYVSNNNGNHAIYRLEDFFNASSEGTKHVTFAIGGNASANPTGFAIPLDFKGTDINIEEQITISGFPVCSWKTSVYANWLAQNSAPIAVTEGSSIFQTLASLGTGNLNGVVSGIEGVASQMAQIQKHSMQPDQARGNYQNGSMNCATGHNNFFFIQMTIKSQYAQIIDNFFEMYGYKVNTMKVPNLSTRPYWNYVQTVDINITGTIPTEDMQELKSIYNKGVTLWHGGDNVGNYNLNNH